MSFNTTCSFCEKGEYDKFKDRKHWIVDTIKRSSPDLISLQEVLSTKQLRWFKKKLKNYHLRYYRKFFIFRYADPALFIKKSRFDIEKSGGLWLGKRNGKFSFGWKFGLPRQIRWVKIREKETMQEYYFVGSHFDNRKKNKERSAKVFTKAFKNKQIPVIFAADTNLKPEMSGFKHITNTYIDSFNIKNKLNFIGENVHKDDSCNLEKGKVFPSCRVDHIFLSKSHNWGVGTWAVDQVKYGQDSKFTSDHRAIWTDVTLQD
jgi:endonuclease/exonuclease/phosphatase family metal-dependent hydrolase